MFLHIGQDEIIPLDGIVAILNARFHLRKKNNSWMMLNNKSQHNHMIVPKIKSIIIMDNGEVFFSHLAAETLTKRITKTQNAQTLIANR